ncbi:Upf3 [Carabus blaptoides fortunei]
MAVSEIDTSECNSDSSVDNTKPGERKDKLFTKVVVRRLPPSMNKESFLNQVSPLPDYDYMYFVKADMSLGEFALSRAYINFKNPNDIFIFKEKFDNYVFVDAKGNEYVAVVEFAPFCRIAKKRNKNKNDPKCGTIETDPIYLEFVESLNQVNTESEEKPEYCFQPTADDDKKVTNTPLLDFIKQRRIDRQKIKEEKREERKRRELERKRMKEEERKGRKRIEHVSHSSNVIKPSIHSKTSTVQLDAIDESKSDTSVKIKEKKYDDYRGKGGKVGSKEYNNDKRPTYTSNKDALRSVDQKKSPSKIRQRNQHMSEKESRPRTEYKSKRDDISSHKGRKDDKDEKVVEKKVKKYSERREERKNEFKRQESKTDSQNASTSESCKEKCKTTDKTNENKQTEKAEHSDEKRSSKDRDESKYQNDFDKVSDSSKEDSRSYRENDPRTQRRIRNKDRPTMAIYQPGMGLGRNRKPNTDGSEDGQKSSAGSDTNKSQ